MYFVTLWTTMSAPSCSGRCRTGVANVLSTTTSAPAACATEATASMSTIFSSGFDGVSIQTTRVSSRIDARTVCGSVRSHAVCVIPQVANTLSSSRWVPP